MTYTDFYPRLCEVPDCPRCHPSEQAGATRTPEQRAAIQQAIADAKTHLATLATDKDQR